MDVKARATREVPHKHKKEIHSILLSAFAWAFVRCMYSLYAFCVPLMCIGLSRLKLTMFTYDNSFSHEIDQFLIKKERSL